MSDLMPAPSFRSAPSTTFRSGRRAGGFSTVGPWRARGRSTRGLRSLMKVWRPGARPARACGCRSFSRSRPRLTPRRAAAEEIENLLVKSLETARRQQALSWQLRTACDLVRLRQEQGRGKEALRLLQSIYDRFTEGFGTADLIQAEALLESRGKAA